MSLKVLSLEGVIWSVSKSPSLSCPVCLLLVPFAGGSEARGATAVGTWTQHVASGEKFLAGRRKTAEPVQGPEPQLLILL